ncbi:MAG: SIMPL domain-containing protein, partial [Patescibacteria group bacterium]
IHDFLTGAGSLEKDIKTTGYNLYPKYEWQEQRIVCIAYPCDQPPGKQVLMGYEVTQSVEVKIRVLDDAGKILGGLSDNGATNLSGLNFLVENEDAVQATAREAAIGKAKAKAAKLADDLGVSLVRIVSFNEGGNYPIYYGRGGMEAKLMSSDAGISAPADIPAGENKYSSSVTIVYEIK